MFWIWQTVCPMFRSHPLDLEISFAIPSQRLPRYLVLRCLYFCTSLTLFSGMYLADASVFISCAMSLAVFDISKCVENGVVNVPVHENTTGTIRYASI